MSFLIDGELFFLRLPSFCETSPILSWWQKRTFELLFFFCFFFFPLTVGFPTRQLSKRLVKGFILCCIFVGKAAKWDQEETIWLFAVLALTRWYEMKVLEGAQEGSWGVLLLATKRQQNKTNKQNNQNPNQQPKQNNQKPNQTAKRNQTQLNNQKQTKNNPRFCGSKETKQTKRAGVFEKLLKKPSSWEYETKQRNNKTNQRHYQRTTTTKTNQTNQTTK